MKWCIVYFLLVVMFCFLSCYGDHEKADLNILDITGVYSVDSIREVLKRNRILYDSFRVMKKYEIAVQFLDKTIVLESILVKDTSLKPFYVSAALYKAYALTRNEKYMEAENILLHLFEIQDNEWKNELQQADALGYLGNIYTRYGDYKKALGYLTSENKILKNAKDTEYYVRSVNNIAIAQQELGNYKISLELLQGSEKWNTPVTESKVILYTRSAIAALHLLDLEMMNTYIAKAEAQLKYFDDEDDKANYNTLIDGLKADYLLSSQKYKKAVEVYRHVIKVNIFLDSTFTRSRDCGKLYHQLGKAYVGMEQFDSALFCFNRGLNSVVAIDTIDIFSLPELSQLFPENTILESLDAKALGLQKLYQAKNDRRYLTTAIQCYTLSFEVEKKLMQYFSYDESKLLMLNESRQRSQKAINLCYQLYQLTKDNQWAQKAFQFAEKNKAFVLLESVKRNLAANAALQNDTLYQNTQKLQLQLAYAERSLAEATGDSAKQKLQQQKAKLENDLLFANTALGRQSIAYKTVMEKEDSISAASVSSGLLNENTGLIEFFNADTVTYGFVLNKNQPIQFIRYNATMSAEIDSLLYFFKTASAIGNHPLPYQKMAHQLYRTLQFDQLDKGWQNLIIIPDGKLSFLPFDALITNTSFTVNLQQAAYFINQCNTLYGYSAAILLKQLHNNQSRHNNTTVFAPVFSNNENHQQPLLYSLQEAEAIGANKNTTSFVKEKATLGNFKQQFANSGILHIATHAYADTGTNSNPKIEFIDSSLLLNELYAMHTNASLVVLSACETGLGRLNTSEGPMSLARGFYYAGAKNVITSYWNVDDKSTTLLFKSFYKKINSSTSADAIYSSKKELIKSENGKFASPYYWAGFVHIGMPQKKEGINYWWTLLILPALIAFYYLLKPKRQQFTSTTLIP